jgi:hypothetical protein
MANDNKGTLEASFIGFGFGAVLGGLVVGSFADIANLPIHSMLAYCIGGVLGGIAGLAAGRVAAAVLVN